MKTRKTHGLSNHRLYNVWRSMLDRCNNPKNDGYRIYGGRGISVCKEWSCSVVPFYNWAIENGWEQGLTIDRIDGNGNYCPQNCRVVTQKINSRNKESTFCVIVNGAKIGLAQYLEDINRIKDYFLIKSRLDYGWPLEKALNLPKGTVFKKRCKSENSPRSKLTNKQAIKIVSEKGSFRTLAKKYGVTHKVIMNIKSGKTYTDATGL